MNVNEAEKAGNKKRGSPKMQQKTIASKTLINPAIRYQKSFDGVFCTAVVFIDVAAEAGREQQKRKTPF